MRVNNNDLSPSNGTRTDNTIMTISIAIAITTTTTESIGFGQLHHAHPHACEQSMRRTIDAFESIVTWIALFVIPVISVIGILSNACVCIVVLQRRTEISDKGKVMYCAMAIADTMQIFVNSIGRVFVISGLKADIGSPTTSSCRLHAFLSVLTIGLSNAYAAVFAVERCVSAYRLSRISLSHVKLLWLLAGVTCLEVLASMPFAWTVDMLGDVHAPRRLCEISPSALADLALIVTEMFTTYLPCVILLAGDLALLIFLLRRQKTLRPAAVKKKRIVSDNPTVTQIDDTSIATTRLVGESDSSKVGKKRNESWQMKAIIGNIKACVIMSSIRSVFLIVSITTIQAYYIVLKFDNGLDPDHCIADLLHALGALTLGAPVLLLASSFYVLLWRVRAFKEGLYKLLRITQLEPQVAYRNSRPTLTPTN